MSEHPVEGEDGAIVAAIHHAGHVLPAQAPIGTFVHHNTLHAFQHLPFHEAVQQAGRVLDTEPYLKEDEYHAAFAAGRIRPEDVDHAFEGRRRRRPRDREEPESIVGVTRDRVERAALLHPVRSMTAAELEWAITEEGLLDRLRADVPGVARESIVGETLSFLRRHAPPELLSALFEGETDVYGALEREHAATPERLAARALFEVARLRLGGKRAQRPRALSQERHRSHRDLMRSRLGVDPADLINPVMIRLCAGYLDLGMAAWPMPGRGAGFYEAFVGLMQTPMAPHPAWMRGLAERVRRHRDERLTAPQVVARALEELGVAPEDRAAYLERVALELPGWAGMFNRIEHDPELRKGIPYPASLTDYLAVRLTYEPLAIAHLARQELDYTGPLANLHQVLAQRRHGAGEVWEAGPDDDAFRLFQLAQVLGLGAPALWGVSTEDCARLVGWLDDFDGVERRRVWHDAYERHHLDEVLGAIVQNARRRDHLPRRETPEYQIAFCIDDREESFRRALEETCPGAETFGIAGFFGMAIEWCGLDDPTPAYLCPVVVTPAHRVAEVPDEDHRAVAERRQLNRARVAALAHGVARGSRSLVRASLMTPFIGMLSAGPLVLRVFFPRTADRLLQKTQDTFLPKPVTRLTGLRDESDFTPAESKAVGFTIAEKADRVEASLRAIGLTRGFAKIVLLLGHGAVSVNNPHASAYDCGACGGKHGGPNARIFAEAANRPEVRAILRERGIDIPDDTLFVGGQHNTTNDDVDLFDLHRAPEGHRARLRELGAVLDRARTLAAHERCRRFESAPLSITPDEALRHVQARAGDLSQARPELGHATNAVAVVGRRTLTEGLFLDRRAFLISYDPTQDPTTTILEKILAAVGPVGAGINLEYYFSRVDNDRYGCGTKLPHNVTGLLGVMDGHASDLRTGLPWQMVEIHEPVRLLLVVESTPEALLQIAGREKEIAELVTNEWIRVCTVDPSTREAHYFDRDLGFVKYETAPLPLPRVSSSREWYGNRRDFLPPAIIAPGSRDTGASPRPRAAPESHADA